MDDSSDDESGDSWGSDTKTSSVSGQRIPISRSSDSSLRLQVFVAEGKARPGDARRWRLVKTDEVLLCGQHIAFVLLNVSKQRLGVSVLYESSRGVISRVAGSQDEAPLLLAPGRGIRCVVGALLVAAGPYGNSGVVPITLRALGVGADDVSESCLVERRLRVARPPVAPSGGPRVGDSYDFDTLSKFIGQIADMRI